MSDLIRQLNSLDAMNDEQRKAIKIIIDLIKNNEINSKQISINDLHQISIFDWGDSIW